MRWAPSKKNLLSWEANIETFVYISCDLALAIYFKQLIKNKKTDHSNPLNESLV